MNNIHLQQNEQNINEQNVIDYLNYEAINRSIPQNININNYNFINNGVGVQSSLNEIFDTDSESISSFSSSDSDYNNDTYSFEEEVEEDDNFCLEFINTIKLNSNKKQECIICKDKLCKEQEVYILPCGHIFHKDCISTWLKKKAECPTCRTDIDIKSYFMDKLENCNNLEDLKKELLNSIKIIKKTEKIIKKIK